jgi:hypothetical protein
MTNQVPGSGYDDEKAKFVTEFEGDPITKMEAKLQAFKVRLSSEYPPGTRLRLEAEVRVTGIWFNENRNGDLIRQHRFALENVSMRSVCPPEAVADVPPRSGHSERWPGSAAGS